MHLRRFGRLTSFVEPLQASSEATVMAVAYLTLAPEKLKRVQFHVFVAQSGLAPEFRPFQPRRELHLLTEHHPHLPHHLSSSS